MKIALVAAQSENRVIGKGTQIPWKVKGEQALFKEITMGGSLILGRKTFETIGRPLPGRNTIIVTRNADLAIAGCTVTTSLEGALDAAAAFAVPAFVAGGGELYAQSIDIADAIHLTTIHTTVDGDVYFPHVPDMFKMVSEKKHSSNIDYTYQYFEKK